VARHLHTSKSRRIPIICGWESNWHFDSRTLLLAIMCVLSTQMGCVNAFYTFTFQDFSNDIMNFSIQWILTFTIVLWKFQSGSPLGSVWVHSLTLSYIPRGMKCDSWTSLLVHTFANSCFNREPKAKIATTYLFSYLPINS